MNKEKIGNLPEQEFKVIVVKMILNLGNRMEAMIEKMQEVINKELEELKNKQMVFNNTNKIQKYTEKNQ